MADKLLNGIRQQDLDLIVEALAQGADPNVTYPDWHGWRPLHAAINELSQGGSVAVVVVLLRYGADPEAWDAGHTVTPLLMALFFDQHEVVRMLLAAGANPNVVGDEGDVPLRWAVENGDLETATLLLHCGAHEAIDLARGFRGMNALGHAVRQLNLPMIELLIAFGADPRRRDSNRRTAHDHLPKRETVEAATWDMAKALLDQVER